jgi:hypothetical protein
MTCDHAIVNTAAPVILPSRGAVNASFPRVDLENLTARK